MALTYTEAQAVSDKGFDKACAQQVYEESALLTKLKLKDKVQAGGRKWAWTIRYTKLENANAVGPRDPISFISKETRTLAEITPRHYVGSTIMHWDELQQNKGKPQIIDLIGDKTKELKEDFADRLATDIFTANGNGLGIDPITTIIDSASSYAGIAVADAADWAAQEDGSTTTLSLYGAASLSYMINQARFGKNMPDFHLTTRDLRSKFESILEAQKNFVAKLGDKEMASAGFENVAFHGAGVFDDPYCTAGTWLGINTDVFYLLYDPDYYMKVSKWEKIDQVGFQYALKKVMGAVLGLKCTQRKSNFKFTALDYTL